MSILSKGDPVLHAESGPIEESPLVQEKRVKRVRSRKVKAAIFGIVLAVALVVLIFGGSLLALPATVSCAPNVKSSYYVVRVPPPNVTSVDPPVVCAGRTATVKVSGQSFVTFNGVLPSVTADGANVTGFTLSDCKEVEVRRRKVTSCAGMEITAVFPPAGSKTSPTDVNFVVTNPVPLKPWIAKVPPANCTVESKLVTVVPAPSVTATDPPFLCQSSTAGKITFTGSYFLRSRKTGQTKDNFPTATVCGADASVATDMSDCSDLPSSVGYDYIRRCRSVDFSTTGAKCRRGDRASIVVTNPAPATCTDASGDATALPVVNPPTVTSVSPLVVCTADGGVQVSVAGTDFVRVGYAEPQFTIDGMYAMAYTDYSTCERTAVGRSNVYTCTRADVTVPIIDATGPRAVAIDIASSEATCSGRTDNVIFLEPRPTLDSVNPQSVCASVSPQSVVASGRFVVDQSHSMTVSIAGGAEDPATLLLGCSESVVAGRKFRTCDSLRFNVPTGTQTGELSLSVTATCSAHLDSAFSVVPSPVITATSVDSVCAAGDTPIEVTGTDFLVERDVPPKVTLGGVSIAGVTADSCAPTTGTFRLCTTLRFTVPKAILPVGSADLVITNGAVAACASAAVKFAVAPAPTISGLTTRFCQNQEGTIDIDGSDFVVDSVRVKLVGADASSYYATSLSSVTGTKISAVFAAGSVPAGAYQVAVENSVTEDCKAYTPAGTFTVFGNNLAIVAATPQAVIAGNEVAVTLYASGFDSVPKFIKFLGTKGNNVTFLEMAHEPGKFDALTVTVPAGTMVADSYSVLALSDTTCTVNAPAMISAVSQQAPVTAQSVVPEAVVLSETTLVTVTAPAALFAVTELPTVFLTGPINTDAATTSVAIGPVTFNSATSIGVAVPKNMFTEGKYRITVVAGAKQTVLDGTISVTSVPAPTISRVSPRALSEDTPQVTIYGANFRQTNYAITLDCSGDQVTGHTIISIAPTAIVARLDLTSASDGSVCTLTLYDKDNKHEAKFHGIAVMDNIRNLRDWHSFGLPYAVCGAAATNATVDGRDFVYLIGGDTDAECTGQASINTVRFTELKPYGDVDGDWIVGPSLPQARSHAAIEMVGTYLYLFGGYSGTSASTTVYRSEVLQPSESPVLRGTIGIVDNSALEPGVYYYSVSAVYGPNDDANPAGESLPSNVVSVVVPAGTKLAGVSLLWDTVDAAVGYSVYRTPTPGTPASSMVFVKSVIETKWTDTGADAPGTATPLPLGSIGKWKDIHVDFRDARMGHSSVHTVADAGTHNVFLFGGKTSASAATAVASYESFSVTVYNPSVPHERERHVVAAWRVGDRTLTEGSFRRAVVLNYATIGYQGYTQAVVLGSSQESQVHAWNYMESSNILMFQQFAESNQTAPFFGYCMFASDKFLYQVGGTDNAAFTPVPSSGRYMAMDATPPPAGNPFMQQYKVSRNSPSTPTAFPACVHTRGNFMLFGGKLAQGLSQTVQIVAA